MPSSRTSRRAFTLLELLVVIGVIAVFIALLLPVFTSARAQARDLKCQSNLRQIVQGILGYATENDGSMPWGVVWNRSINHTHPQGHPDPYHPRNTWRQADDNAGSTGDPSDEHPFISWASLISRHAVRRGDNTVKNFPSVYQCPEAAMSRPHMVGYVMNFAIAISPEYELQVGLPPSAQLKPQIQSRMLKETALIWDTAIGFNWEHEPGYLVSGDLDAQRFWQGADVPQFRYYQVKDIYGLLVAGTHGHNGPVKLSMPPPHGFYNKDPGPHEGPHPYQGNLRFRHRKDTTCNAGFADGSVRHFTARMGYDRWVQHKGHDAYRRYFMTRWPNGVPVNRDYPH